MRRLLILAIILFLSCLHHLPVSSQVNSTPQTEHNSSLFSSASYIIDDNDQTEPVLTGIDVLLQQNFAPLRGKRIGLVTNQTGITRYGESTLDVLAYSDEINLVALFAPEHGIRGNVTAGQRVQNGHDPATGLPVYSLYGATRRPSRASLRGIQALVFDMQDIGSRSYTYIATLGQCMQACAIAKIPLVVLDRPNLLGGTVIEGNIPSQKFRSFVCPYPIPYRYAMTIGELARMINGRGWLPGGRRCALTVIKMQGYRRSMRAEETAQPWIRTSPNIPHQRTPLYYAATGIIGELSTVSIGVGTNIPFEVVGAPALNASALAAELTRRNLTGCEFRTAQWRPARGSFRGRQCSGVRVYITDISRTRLTRINFEVMNAIHKIAPRYKLFGRSRSQDRMFDMVCGTDRVRRMFLAGASSQQIWRAWHTATSFSSQRRPYLLYG